MNFGEAVWEGGGRGCSRIKAWGGQVSIRRRGRKRALRPEEQDFVERWTGDKKLRGGRGTCFRGAPKLLGDQRYPYTRLFGGDC